jgi:hypothetical protein
MKTISTPKKLECLAKLQKIHDFTKNGDNYFIYDFLKANDIVITYVPVLKSAGVIRVKSKKNVEGKRGTTLAYVWNTIEPNIYMAEKTLQLIVDYNKKGLERQKERIKQKQGKLNLQEKPIEKEKVEASTEKLQETRKMLNYSEIEKLFGTPLMDVETYQEKIEKLQSEVERLDKLNKHLEHQLDYAKNVENKEVEGELVKAMNLNSEKSLIIGNMAMQLDKKDDEIKLIADLKNQTKTLIGVIMSLKDTVLDQDSMVDKFNKAINDLKQNPKTEKKQKVEEKTTRHFSILWGLITIKN